MHPDAEQWPPPNDPVAFESLCLDLFREIWGPESGAQKNGRSGQPQAGVDVFGRDEGRWAGVQCKQKDGLLWREVTVAELEEEVRKALSFQPPLDLFILATTGPADVKVQKRGRLFTEEHAASGKFRVEVWAWRELWHELHGRKELLARIGPIYWPSLHGISPQRIEASRLTHSAPKLFGRDAEMARLEAAWADPATHVLTLVAWGGVGKTSLVAEWQGHLAARNFDGADYFDWSFYSQGTRQEGNPSADSFVNAALEFFGDPELAKSPTGPWEKGAALAKLVAKRRTLLVLDGLEPLQYGPGSPLAGELKDPALQALLKGLAGRNPGLCVVTTRESVKDLQSFHASTAPEVQVERLSREAGVQLLRGLGVLGRESEIETLVEDVDGHALTLNILGTYLKKAHGGDVRRRDRVDLQKADAKVQGGHAFKAMAAYEKWLGEGGEEGARQLAVLRLLCLFDRPADAGCIAALRREPAIPGLTEPLMGIDEDDWSWSCSALEGCKLLVRKHRSLDSHPLVREYFATQLEREHDEAWRTAHGRLFDYLQNVAVRVRHTAMPFRRMNRICDHGWKAGREAEVFLLLMGVVTKQQPPRCCFCVPDLPFPFYPSRLVLCGNLWAPSDIREANLEGSQEKTLAKAQSVILPLTPSLLRDLARVCKSHTPTSFASSMFSWEEKNLVSARICMSLAETLLVLGELRFAEQAAEQAVHFADNSNDMTSRICTRSTLASVLHHVGRRAAALVLFRDAEQQVKTMQSKEYELWSAPVFHLCDLLLANSERAAWRTVLRFGKKTRNNHKSAAGCAEAMARLRSIFYRTCPYHTLNSHFLYEIICRKIATYLKLCPEATALLVDFDFGITTDDPPRSGRSSEAIIDILTRALLHATNGDKPAARADLDEAWEIAERGPMPLYQADIHLHRARLFKDKVALAEARRLIEKHGYWRRREELEDAEEAAKGW